jgi:hypothetical protein
MVIALYPTRRVPRWTGALLASATGRDHAMVIALYPTRPTPSVARVPAVVRHAARKVLDPTAEIVLLEIARYAYDSQPPRSLTTTPWRLCRFVERLWDLDPESLIPAFDELLEFGFLFGDEAGYRFCAPIAEFLAAAWLEARR